MGDQPNGSHLMWGKLESSSSSKGKSSSESGVSGRSHSDSGKKKPRSLPDDLILKDSETSDSNISVNSGPQSDYEKSAVGASSSKDPGERSEIPGEDDEHLRMLRSLSPEQLLPLIPADENGNPLSIGSLRHHTSKCTPCTFTIRQRGCKPGIYCNFCHYMHSDEVEAKKLKARPCKGQRMRFQKYVDKLKEVAEQNLDGFDPAKVVYPPSIDSDPDKKEQVLAALIEHVNTLKAQRAASRSSRSMVETRMSL